MKLLYPFVMLVSVFLFSCRKEGSSDESFASGISGNTGVSGNDQAGVITAGEWNDLDHWDFWLNLQGNEIFKDVKSNYRYDLATKVTVKLLSADNIPLEDEPVSLQTSDGTVLWDGRTDNKGIAQLFIGKAKSTVPFKVNVPGRGFSAAGVYSTGVTEYKVPVAAGTVSNADIAFVVDATGSMGDEISFLKNELLDVINRVKSGHPGMELRTGSIFYRDEGDEYVTRQNNFTNNGSTTIDFIRNQKAAGGGDFPEAVHTAVKEAVEQLSWSAKAKSRIMFLILDAPPHQEDKVLATLEAQVKAAAGKGIRIVPVTASGINKLTEYLMRQMAIATNGTYVFITNHSGIGNDHLEASVGEYEVEYLNNLMVRLINKYLE
jgi:hypothetical protein